MSGTDYTKPPGPGDGTTHRWAPRLDPEADPKCRRCKGTGRMAYVDSDGDVDVDVCDCVLERANGEWGKR